MLENFLNTSMPKNIGKNLIITDETYIELVFKTKTLIKGLFRVILETFPYHKIY